MPATPAETPILPLRFLLTPPSSVDEAVARCANASGRLIAQLWDRQRLIENCTVRVQACLFSTAEQLWRQSLESCYLREPRRTERVRVV